MASPTHQVVHHHELPSEPVRYYAGDHIFLASSLEAMDNISLKELRKPKVLYVSTPANPDRIDGKESWTVRQTRKWLAGLALTQGLSYEEYDITGKSKTEIAKAVGLAGCVFLSNGRDPAYFSAVAHDTGFGDVIKDGVAAGKIVFAGLSTGAGFAGNRIDHLVSVVQSPTYKHLERIDGIGLVDGPVYPHWLTAEFMSLVNEEGLNYQALWAADHAAGLPTLRLAD